MSKHTIAVTQIVNVELNDAAFTDKFMAEFSDNFYDFPEIRDHAEHIAQLVARGVIDEISPRSTVFVEGYGKIGDFVDEAVITDTEINIE